MRVFRNEEISNSTHFTMGMDASIDDEIIDECGMRDSLSRFGKMLLEQKKSHRGGSEIIGVQFNAIAVTFILKD